MSPIEDKWGLDVTVGSEIALNWLHDKKQTITAPTKHHAPFESFIEKS